MKKKLPEFDNIARDPFSYLGRHEEKGKTVIRVFSPDTKKIAIHQANNVMQRIGNSDYFELSKNINEIPEHYTLYIENNAHELSRKIDPYSFSTIIPEYDLHIFAKGNHWSIYQFLGANAVTVDNIDGFLFALWAPNANRISVVGNFNDWDGRCHPMRNRNGIWEIFIPGVTENHYYKFEMIDNNHRLMLKNDPYGRQYQFRPDTAAITTNPSTFEWQDQKWLTKRQQNNWQNTACSIYEIHLGSWRRDKNHYFFNYRTIAHELVEYLKPLGFTHIELLPITEHPLDASWGYQALGYFAPTSRFGSPDDFRYFVNYLHQHNIGIILDWVPAHFPTDDHGLARFDGTALYEHEDPRKGEHRDWGTYIFNYERNEVKNFLIASALFWLKEFHLDGLRVDAVASMLYLDYSRNDNDWIPNQYGGNENLEAVEFLKHLNSVTLSQHPGTVVIAEESTAWPAVSKPTENGGLGFNMKWNMGWMHDTLEYCQYDPVHRAHHHDKLTFGLMYAFTENFVLPFSHDEVVHGKGSLLYKMPGDDWQKFATLRLLYTFMFSYPGKKLIFMGCEFAQTQEWDNDTAISWDLLQYDEHKGMLELIKDLNQLYQSKSALHYYDFEPQGFQWIDCENSAQSIFSYIRHHNGKMIIVILNFTPVPRESFTLNVVSAGAYKEIFNSDSHFYAGSNYGGNGSGNATELYAQQQTHDSFPYFLTLNLPPLGGLILELIN